MSRARALARIREGWELHRDRTGPAAPGDPDLALLLGDRRYADGLLELVGDEDLEGVRVMADVITACARAQAECAPGVAEAAWAAAERQLLEGEKAAVPRGAERARDGVEFPR